MLLSKDSCTFGGFSGLNSEGNLHVRKKGCYCDFSAHGSILVLTPKYEGKHEALHESKTRKCKSVMVNVASDALIDVVMHDCVASNLDFVVNFW